MDREKLTAQETRKIVPGTKALEIEEATECGFGGSGACLSTAIAERSEGAQARAGTDVLWVQVKTGPSKNCCVCP